MTTSTWTGALFACLLFPALDACAESPIPAERTGKAEQSGDWTVYRPANLPQGKRPVLLAFHPGAAWTEMVDLWGPVADRLGWILLANRVSRNGQDMLESCTRFVAQLDELAKAYPLDLKRVASTGFSGGAMLSHFLAMHAPDRIHGVIANTGMINRAFLGRDDYPTGKTVVFLASPTGFRYTHMKADREALQKKGWSVKWTEFEGGHVLAPRSACLEAARWIEASWKAPSKQKK